MSFNASKAGRADMKLILNGLRKVGAAILSHQEKEFQYRWVNSSLRPVFNNLLNKLNEQNNLHTVETMERKGTITYEKISMVTEGIEQFIKFNLCKNQAGMSTLNVNQQYASTDESTSAIQHEAGQASETAKCAELDKSLPLQAVHLDSGKAKNTVDSTGIAFTSANLNNAASNDEQKEVLVKESDFTEPGYSESLLDLSQVPLSGPHPRVVTTTQEIFNPEKKILNEDVSLLKQNVNYAQKLSKRSRERKVPASQLSRLMSYGELAAGLGVGTLAEVTRRTLGLKKAPSSSAPLLDSSIFLNEANAERIVNTLCKVRGAALKLGQMLSLQDNTIMNPQLQNVFERVRQSADFMPTWQAQKVLAEELGADWKSKVASFEDRPFAAASIGQVHLAVLHDGRKVAMKIQYPGVATSIESDIRNLTSTLKVWKIIPPGFFIDHLMAVARRELAVEVDYINEAKCAKRFKELLKPYQSYFVPEVIHELSTRQVYTTELIDGLPLDKCFNLDAEVRNEIASNILNLCLMELCQFNFMQTDPNWSNFFYNPAMKKLCLLDFGASREYSKDFVNKYMRIIKAAMDKDKELILKYSLEVGFLTGYESKLMENAHVNAVLILGEAFSHDGKFNFGTQNMTRRIQDVVPVMLENRLTPPPEEIYSLHRKLAGVFLLCTKLQAQINCKQLFDRVYENL